MIERDHGLSLLRRARALGTGRAGIHCRPRPAPDADPALMRRLDELPLDHPVAGGRVGCWEAC